MSKDKPYTNPSTAPVKYFTLLRILSVFWLIFRIIQFALLFNKFNWYSFIYNLLGTVFTLFAFIGMKDMKWYGIMAVFGISVLGLLDGIAALVIISLWELSQPVGNTVWGQILTNSIILFIDWRYFSNRRLLFMPLPKKYIPDSSCANEAKTTYTSNPLSSQIQPVSTPSSASAAHQSLPKHQIRFCRKCGFRLLDGSRFCSNCGTAIPEENKNVLS